MAKNNLGEWTKQELVIIRIFDAPRELVWMAWTEPEHFMRWWGPKDFTAPFCQIDLRVGGKYLNCMRSSNGKDYWSTGVYREIVPMERLVFTDSFGKLALNPYCAAGTILPFSSAKLSVKTSRSIGTISRYTPVLQ